jgi:sec-independent protein translocase protein TatC
MSRAVSAEYEEAVDKYMPFLVEVRRRLFFVISLFLAASAVGFIYYEKIVFFVLQALDLQGVNIVFTSPFQFVNLAITIGLLVGTIVVFPLIVLQVILFLKPALQPKEFRWLIAILNSGFFLFAFGFGYGIVLMKYVIGIFYEKSLELTIGNFLDISMLLSQILLTAILMGLAFQFPIVLTVLMRFGIVKYKQLVGQRITAYMSSIIFAAFLPPTDVFSLILLTLPLVLLFEFALIFNKIVLKSHLL